MSKLHIKKGDTVDVNSGEDKGKTCLLYTSNATVQMAVVPMLCGSSFKNKGVQTLLDYVCAFLPSPLDLSLIHISVEQRSESGSTDANAPVTQYIEPCQRCSYHFAFSGYGTWSVLYYEAAQGCQG